MSNRPAVVQVSASAWQAYRKAQAIATAAQKDAEQLKAALGLPDASKLAYSLGLHTGDKGEVIVQDGNSQAIGKISVFYYPGAQIPAAWRSRAS